MTAHHRHQAQQTADKVRQLLDSPRDDTTRPDPANRPSPQRAGSTLFSDLPEYETMRITRAIGEITGISNPFHRLHDGRACETTTIDGRTVVNFSSYDYLGLNSHDAVSAAAHVAIDRFGTSVSASRLSAGERQIHRDLEGALARL